MFHKGSSPRTRSGVLVLVLLLVIAAAIAAMAAAQTALEDSPKFRDVRTAVETIYIVTRSFHKPVAVSDMVRAYLAQGTVPGMLETLKDPYTRYMSPTDFRRLRDDNVGVFGGIGILVGIRDKKITVISPIENTPGMRAGLLPGDHIVEINGISTEGMVLDRAVSMMRGEPGTQVILLIERGRDRRQFKVDIIREIIDAPSTRHYILDKDYGIGYIQLRTFSQKASSDVESDIGKLVGLGMNGLILDLRYNGGGLLDQAIDTASKFIPPGPVLHVQGRGSERETRNTSGTRIWHGPMVVLVNEFTASASEILTGALQDYGVAVVVGTPTFGKGLVQTIFPLSDGSGLAVTTQVYLTAKGRAITPDTPLEPDVLVTVPDPEADGEETEPMEGPITVESLLGIDPEKDVQLRRAMDILRDLIKSQSQTKNAA